MSETTDFMAQQQGVRFVEPPAHIITEAIADIRQVTEFLKPGQAAVVGVTDRQGGWNAAFVVKEAHDISLKFWIGKTWGNQERLNWGAAVIKVIDL